MTIKSFVRVFALSACLSLTGCSLFMEKDNTPPPANLVQFTPIIKPHQLWDNRIEYEASHERLQLDPAVTDYHVVTIDTHGTVTVVDKFTGKTYWKPTLNKSVSASIAANDNMVIVATRSGQIYALNITAKKTQWNANVGNEILAAPAISNGVVVVKAIDGRVSAFSTTDGHHLWSHQELEPNLILRAASTPQVAQDAVVIGYASGKIVKLGLHSGRVLWSQTLAVPEGAFAIQRMIDIDANPVISGSRVYAATYQGKIAALNFSNGNVLWDHDISAYSGIAVDEHHVYVSDAKSDVWAFDKETGRVSWKQSQLEYRDLTGPASTGNYIVVGDAEGALHWLNKQDGSFAGRVQLGGKGIYANPIAEGQTAYILTQDGYLVAYRV